MIPVLVSLALLIVPGCCVGGGSSPTGLPTGVCLEPLWWTVRNAVVGPGRAGAMVELQNGELVQLLGVCDRPWHQLGAGDAIRRCLGHLPGEEASRFIEARVKGTRVRIELGDGLTYFHPRIGRLGAYVFLEDGTFLNEALIREGYARFTEQPNVYGGAVPRRYAAVLREAERQARTERRGFWKASADGLAVRAAIDRHDVAGLEEVLAGGAAADFRDPMDRTPLLYAAETGAAEVVELLLEHGAEIEAREARRGHTPLLAAAESGRAGVLRILLGHGADASAVMRKKRSALILAAASGDVEAVRLLLSHVAEVDATDEDGESALIAGARSGNAEVVRVLLQQGAAVDRGMRSPRGWVAMHSAAAAGSVSAVGVLLEGGAAVDPVADVPGRGRSSPLQLVVARGDTPTAAFLLEHGADANFESGRPLMLAAVRGDERMTVLLLEHGADARRRDGAGSTPLDRALDPAVRAALARAMAAGGSEVE